MFLIVLVLAGFPHLSPMLFQRFVSVPSPPHVFFHLASDLTCQSLQSENDSSATDKSCSFTAVSIVGRPWPR
ncbi:hypothetical protein B0J13DRAFT_549659 [Dactylonectria estremocensis]|uniref:Secreted protein n=1 Tax=Dactylonectria estremocensis TaxID=1079267 RepID=A0A9P9F320_9HYPO|nr:hypothetical protein B0J13DRAFT_549659 [Dactylonectria estremocensis]